MDYGLVGFGNAVLDAAIDIDDAGLARLGVTKGAMTLVPDAEDPHPLPPGALVSSGGSVANTVAGFAALGGFGAFVGKIGSDPEGEAFRDALLGAGVVYDVWPSKAPTGRCTVWTTPDGERSMRTRLGASRDLCEDDVVGALDLVSQARMILVEGYLWDAPTSRGAARRAIETAAGCRVPTAVSLSDPRCAAGIIDELVTEAVAGRIFFVVANTAEATAATGTADRLSAAKALSRVFPLSVVTGGGEGCLVAHRDAEPVAVPARRVDAVVDTTGAGDMFAAGLLLGLTQGMSAERAAGLGAAAAGSVVRRRGPRAAFDDEDLAAIMSYLPSFGAPAQ